MKRIKFAMAAAALVFSANAAAMPPQTPDRYYDTMWNWVWVVMGAHRPCVGPAASWC
jgi:hypothetical protein